MTASMLTPPTKPLSINIDFTERKDEDALNVRNKGRTNYTAACFYSAADGSAQPQPEGGVVSEPPNDPQPAKGICTIGDASPSPHTSTHTPTQTPMNKDVLSSPQSVTLNSHGASAGAILASAMVTAETSNTITADTCQRPSPPKKRGSVTSNATMRKIDTSYDMNLVPKVKKSPGFLRKWRQTFHTNHYTAFQGISVCASASPNINAGTTTASTAVPSSFSYSPSSYSLPGLVSCDGSFSEPAEADTGLVMCTEKNDSAHSSSHDEDPRPNIPCHACFQTHDTDPVSTTTLIPISPFALDSESVIWVPKTRSQWEDCIDEMVAVCTAAAWHKHRSNRTLRKKKDFHAPISRLYIEERVKIDDPLRGYQIRHKYGWLQGFVMMTTFTIWTHYFKWDTNHPANGIDHTKPKGMLDDGSLAIELEKQFRSGDPLSEGVVWSTVAEMSLVGALGCGEYLLQMALDDIARRGVYEYVVLEATETSRPFYEKFGFVRVGAICKYGKEQDVASGNQGIEVVGYRHWTYPESTVENLSVHGSPSCMMARKVIPRTSQVVGEGCHSCGNKIKPSFVDELSQFFVTEKPRIKKLPVNSSGRKRSMSGNGTPMTKATKLAKVASPGRITSSGRRSKAPSRLDEAVDKPKPRKTPAARTSRNSSTPTVIAVQGLPIKVRGKSNKPMLLRKQKIPSMYRSPKKLYFYNKVVTPKPGAVHPNVDYKSRYYFVINYDIDTEEIRAIPLFLRGQFKGKREGRPKWKAHVLPRNEKSNEQNYLKTMDVITSPCSNWDIVESYAVTKCASVQEESWDVLV